MRWLTRFFDQTAQSTQVYTLIIRSYGTGGLTLRFDRRKLHCATHGTPYSRLHVVFFVRVCVWWYGDKGRRCVSTENTTGWMVCPSSLNMIFKMIHYNDGVRSISTSRYLWNTWLKSMIFLLGFHHHVFFHPITEFEMIMIGTMPTQDLFRFWPA